MSIAIVKRSAALSRATLVGQSLAEKVKEEDFWTDLESAEDVQERDAAMNVCTDFESLDVSDIHDVVVFLDMHFRSDVEGFDDEQKWEAAKAFAAGLC